MEFCPSCETRLILTRNSEYIIFSCSRCGYQKIANPKPVTSKTVVNPTFVNDIIVIGKKEQTLRKSTTAKIKCQKCGSNLAYTWQVQTRSGDEGATQFFKCIKCDYTFRLYT
jgi:DNA-directed RNA polymerase subunit M